MKTSSISAFGGRQRELLTLLLETKTGLSADELAERLSISRSAVHQHLTGLEGSGYVEKDVRPSGGGRPGYVWRLSEPGIDLFPKQYALFSDLLIQALEKELGSEGLTKMLTALGQDLAQRYAHRLAGKSLEQKVAIVAEIMQQLGYQARAVPDTRGKLPLIDARNCIYHHLAREHKEVCALDLALLSSLLGSKIEHVECMVRGGGACKFRVLNSRAGRK